MTASYSSDELKRKAFGRLLIAFAVLAATFFVSAGTVSYWEAWLYLAVLFVPAVGVVFYLLRHAPDLLERRMRMRERERPQKLIVKLSSVAFLAAFVLPGLDRRFG